jgi:hypothetical protein
MVIFFAGLFFVSLLFLFAGLLMKKHYSKFPDTSVGYHTNGLAIMNENTWVTANTYSGNLLLCSGIVTLVLNIIILILSIFLIEIIGKAQCEAYLFAYLICSIIIPVVLLFVLTETHLRKKYDKDGHTRQ